MNAGPDDPLGAVGRVIDGKYRVERFVAEGGFSYVYRARHETWSTWEMAREYCSFADARLPTSAEWELAVRGPDGRIYPWGDAPPDATRLNACGAECARWGKEHGVSLPTMYPEDDGYSTTAPVGSFPAGRSRYGLDDVIGNVMQWTADRDGPYAASERPLADPTGPAEGTERVIRGGAWNAADRAWVRPSFRFHFPAGARSYAVGFRCARGAS